MALVRVIDADEEQRTLPKNELLLHASRLGATEVITKPFAFEQLKGAVARALR